MPQLFVHLRLYAKPSLKAGHGLMQGHVLLDGYRQALARHGIGFDEALVQPEEMTEAGGYRLVDVNPIKLRAQVPERYVASIKTGQKVKTSVDAYPGVDFAGKVSRVNPQINLENRMFSVEILIPNDDHRLKPGAFARASVETSAGASGTTP